MPTDTSEGGSTAERRAFPDPHGQAALLLMESLLHGLLERNVLTIADAVSIAESAAEVKEAVIEEYGEPAAAGGQSLHLIKRITDSLMVDRLGRDFAPADR